MKKVVVLGCGAWATAVAGILAENIHGSYNYTNEIHIYAYDLTPDGHYLSDVINNQRVNKIYLPDYKVPSNVIASNNVQKVVKDADIIFVIYPPKHVKWLTSEIAGHIKTDAYFVSYCKGVVFTRSAESLTLISDYITEKTQRPCVVVMGANNAIDVTKREFTEATIGTKNTVYGKEIKNLLQCDYYRLKIVADAAGVELCGALKHIIAIAAGISDGLNLSTNGKAALLRIGFWEMYKLMEELFPERGVEWMTIEESCGMAELFTCMAGHPYQIPKIGYDMDLVNVVFGTHLSGVEELPPDSNKLDKEFVDGAEYAAVIYHILQSKNRQHCYPLISAVHNICERISEPGELMNALKCHPIHS